MMPRPVHRDIVCQIEPLLSAHPWSQGNMLWLGSARGRMGSGATGDMARGALFRPSAADDVLRQSLSRRLSHHHPTPGCPSSPAWSLQALLRAWMRLNCSDPTARVAYFDLTLGSLSSPASRASSFSLFPARHRHTNPRDLTHRHPYTTHTMPHSPCQALDTTTVLDSSLLPLVSNLVSPLPFGPSHGDTPAPPGPVLVCMLRSSSDACGTCPGHTLSLSVCSLVYARISTFGLLVPSFRS